jgi:integrase
MGPNTSSESRSLSVKQLATALNISTNWIYKRTAPGCPDPLPHLSIGRSKRFELEKVRLHLETRQSNGSSATLSNTGGIARVNGKVLKRMTRRRFQNGYVRLREDRKQPWWEGFYWSDSIQEDGKITRKRKSVKIGLQEDLPTKRTALRKLSEILSQINDTNYRPKSAMSFRSFISKYRELKLATKKGTTQHGYETNIRAHYLPHFADEPLAEIDTEQIQAFINQKATKEKKSFNTLKNLKWGLSSIFAAAVKFGYIKENPVRNADLPPRDVREEEKLPTAEHLDKLIARLEEPYSTMVWLHAVAIPRPSEGFAFKWSDLNTETNQLMVVRAVNRGKFHTPKYHRVNRPVQLTPADVQRLLALKKLQNAADSDWIFPSENPEAPLRHEDVLSRKIQPKARELGLPHVTWRMLRKWGSTHLIANRLPVNAVQERLGHSRPDIVLIHYARLLDESAVAAAATVSSKLSAHSAELENAGFKPFGSQLAAKRQPVFSPVAVSD